MSERTFKALRVGRLASPDYAKQFVIYTESESGSVAIVMGEEGEKYAHLMAAAPELLAACKAVLAWGDRECMPQGGASDCPFEQVEAAIAKATGKEQSDG